MSWSLQCQDETVKKAEYLKISEILLDKSTTKMVKMRAFFVNDFEYLWPYKFYIKAKIV